MAIVGHMIECWNCGACRDVDGFARVGWFERKCAVKAFFQARSGDMDYDIVVRVID